MPSKTELAIAGFYDGIYHFYSAANFCLTFTLDRYWRRRAAGIAKRSVPQALTALDVCCGTGDFCLALKKTFGGQLEISGADLSAAMLSVAKKKYPDIKFLQAEAKKLPWPDDSFDLVTIAFSTRNLNVDKPKLLAALREFCRVLKPGGVFLHLETTRPKNPLIWLLMRIYVRSAVGALNLVSPQTSQAYLFLRNTILNFFTAAEFDRLLTEAGFTTPSHLTLCPGAVAVHTARK